MIILKVTKNKISPSFSLCKIHFWKNHMRIKVTAARHPPPPPVNYLHVKYLSQQFDNNVLDLVKPKVFYPYRYKSNFEKLKEELPSKEKFYIGLTNKENEHAVNV